MFSSPPWHNQSRKSVSLLCPLRLWEFMHLDVGFLMSVRDVTQWLEHMSSSEKRSEGEEDAARCLNQQWSFHLRLMLPFIMLKPLKCTFRQFVFQQGWGHKMEWLQNTVLWKEKTHIHHKMLLECEFLNCCGHGYQVRWTGKWGKQN